MAALVLPEYYADLAQTTLSSSYTAGAGSIVVTTAANLSTTRQFHFMITDQTTGAVKAIGKATALTSSTFTVTMTTDANANSGDFVTITLCAAAEDQIRTDMSQFGTFANLPTVAKAGDRYKGTDTPYEWIYQSGAWQAFLYGMPVTLPPSGGWTSENLSTGTVNYTNGYGYLIGGTTGAIETQYAAAPGSTPYSFIARFRVDQTGIISRVFTGNTPALATFAGWCIGWRDGSGKYSVMITAGTSGNNYALLKNYHMSSFSSLTTGVGPGLSGIDLYSALWGNPNGFWIKIKNDGTNLTWSVSIDRINWYIYWSETITTYLAAATSVVWGSVVSGSGAAICLDDWTQGT